MEIENKIETVIILKAGESITLGPVTINYYSSGDGNVPLRIKVEISENLNPSKRENPEGK